MNIEKSPLPRFSTKLKSAARKSLALAADWAVRNQVRDAWPFWDANKGRFPYHIRINPRKRAADGSMLSTCWKTARTAQALFAAYQVTGDKEYLASANLALDYVSTLQVLEPGYEQWYGSFREDSPQGAHIALRDGMEAVQAFIDGYLVTGNERHLRRAALGADFVMRTFDKDHFTGGLGYPFQDKKVQLGKHFCFYAGALPLAQLSKITGNKEYLHKGAVPMMDYIIANHILPNGALGIKGDVPTDHHTSMPGQYRNVISNDDGMGPAMLSVYRLTGDEKYLACARGMADFWVNAGIDPANLAGYSSISLYLSDLYRLTGEKKYLPLIERFTAKTIDLQYIDKKDSVLNGCFIGEDMAQHYDKKSKPKDWVDLRITSYTLIAFSKIAARKPSEWNCAYSCFGW